MKDEGRGMKKPLLGLLLMTTIMSFVFFMSGAQSLYSVEKEKASERKIQEELVIAHTEIFGKLQRPQVVFDHSRHAGALKKEGCNACHPLTPDGDYIFDFPFKAANKTAKETEDLYHEKCISCHKKAIKEKKKSLPVRCGDCHVKKFESFTIKYPVFEFDSALHDKHVKKLKEKTGKEDCGLCHHTYDIEEEDEALRLVYEKGTEESCYYCHELGKKRGPELTAITQVAAKKGLSIRKASHQQCLNCHLEYQKKGDKETGPTDCMKCHTGKYKTVAELEKVPRPNRDQPKRAFITIEGAKMKGVHFDHSFHEKNTKNCRFCHHETLNTCKKCHGLTGIPEGKWINIAGAYHDMLSEKSCAGCHKKKKSEKDCAGCHHRMLETDILSNDSNKAICSSCHSGKREGSISSKPLSLSALNTTEVSEKVTIKIIEKEYEPSVFPHRKVISKLIEISNESRMATYFHKNTQTICKGCHHRSSAEAEVQKNQPPFCRNCHAISFDKQNLNRPRLLAAYHRQCLGCHEEMNIRQKGCTDCHKEKSQGKVLSRNMTQGEMILE